ncbi:MULTISPECIES: hypothetical protein [Paenibacillus]|uniref:Uncharacterized protein n=1 Tax=Paenibacillus arenosi TaxID=2774142 RepID=A0ABR9AZV3_9BACL|nr:MULTISPECIES: hypothetical protein [Paenibacillus]MBD8499406.1 hypothetical protein [Paenibacillus arenosi]
MNTTSIVSAPAQRVRHVFIQHGFTGISCKEKETFVLGWIDQEMDELRASHVFTVPAIYLPDGKLLIEAEKASFSGYGQVPDNIQAQAHEQLNEILAALKDDRSVPREETHSYKPLDSERMPFPES